MELDHMVSAADALAEQAHAGQTDKAGRPYVEHPRRVAARFEDPVLRTVALLHDVVEDTHVTLNDLHRLFPTNVVMAVDALTHRKGEDRDLYYRRVRANERARLVKHADIDDNADPQRLALLDEATRDRLVAKYEKARAALPPVQPIHTKDHR